MNKSKIEYVDHTWNPITGCRHSCPYCYAKRLTARVAGDVRLNKMAKKDYSIAPAADGGEDLYVLDAPMLNETGRPLVYPFGFAPTLHRYRLDTPAKLKMGNNIFVGAMADVFGNWVPDEWISEIFNICRKYPIHNYLFLTKNPERYKKYGVPYGVNNNNLWYGTSITKKDDIQKIDYLPAQGNTYLSIEPLLENLEIPKECCIPEWIKWVIIGAETGRVREKVIPSKEWVADIVEWCDRTGIPVFMKDSLQPIVGKDNMRRDFPEQMKHSELSPKMKKSDMITLLARSRRGEQPKQFGFMCKECFKNFCKSLGLDIPELEELVSSITIKMEEK